MDTDTGETASDEPHEGSKADWSSVDVRSRIAEPNTVKCPHCAEQIQWDASVCKHCGRRVSRSDRSYRGLVIGAVTVLALAGVIFAVVHASGGGKTGGVAHAVAVQVGVSDSAVSCKSEQHSSSEYVCGWQQDGSPNCDMLSYNPRRDSLSGVIDDNGDSDCPNQ